MRCHHPDLGSASDWPMARGNFASANQKHCPNLGTLSETHHQYGISAIVAYGIRGSNYVIHWMLEIYPHFEQLHVKHFNSQVQD